MPPVKTPCIGICSTTSFGDRVCRGCKRYAFEVIDWHGYGDEEKAAVLRRIEKLITQLLENRFRIFSVPSLKRGLEQFRVPYDPTLSPYCWLHNLLRKKHRDINNLSDFGVYVLSDHAALGLDELCAQVEEELQQLSLAHFERYVGPGHRARSA